MTAIERLRAAAAVLEKAGDAGAAEVAAAIRRYEREAPSGRSLDDALGLIPRGGAGPWWCQDAREQRDEALRKLFETCFPGRPVYDAAREITTIAGRRRSASNAPANKPEQLVDEALKSGAKFPKLKRLAAILGNFTRPVEYRA